MSKTIAVINGPNINSLGTREPEIYGYDTLKDIENECADLCRSLAYEAIFSQSNSEGGVVDAIQHAAKNADGIAINAAAYTHTSIAIYDALKASGIPFIEVHLSNPHSREEFRHFSYLSKIANGVVAGFGKHSYILAIRGLAQILSKV